MIGPSVKSTSNTQCSIPNKTPKNVMRTRAPAVLINSNFNWLWSMVDPSFLSSSSWLASLVDQRGVLDGGRKADHDPRRQLHTGAAELTRLKLFLYYEIFLQSSLFVIYYYNITNSTTFGAFILALINNIIINYHTNSIFGILFCHSSKISFLTDLTWMFNIFIQWNI